MISFVGAGPGDPELITLKGRRLLDEAEMIIYAGSLVNPALLPQRERCRIYDSSGLNLDEVLALLFEAAEKNLACVRLHTGDPSLYGAIREQIDALEKRKIPYEVVPGVSSFSAAAAALGREFTLPGVSQSLIISRQAGRTPVPEKESLSSLAVHQTSMALFLSIGQIETLCGELIAGGYPAETPAAVVYRATWPDQKIVSATLEDLPDKVREAGITRQAMILVGGFLGRDFDLSKLYDPGFSHGWRQAKVQDLEGGGGKL